MRIHWTVGVLSLLSLLAASDLRAEGKSVCVKNGESIRVPGKDMKEIWANCPKLGGTWKKVEAEPVAAAPAAPPAPAAPEPPAPAPAQEEPPPPSRPASGGW